ncbi:MAG: SPOR domain-containing protein [Firmicutes bacterium]|nr:SPOR domain-containing protein [Bacillota bacterium]
MIMRRSRHRRTYRRNVSANRYAKKTGMNLFAVAVIIGLAVALGFLTTKCVIYPLILGQEASFDVVLDKIGFIGDKTNAEDSIEDSNNADNQENQTNNVNNDNNVSAPSITQGNNVAIPTTNAGINEQEANPAQQTLQSGYVIQFGSFSSEGAADQLVNELKNSGIDASIAQKDGLYKVVGQIFADKESALNNKVNIDALTGAKYSDAFVTSF